jgi:hypothetical protein
MFLASSLSAQARHCLPVGLVAVEGLCCQVSHVILGFQQVPEVKRSESFNIFKLSLVHRRVSVHIFLLLSSGKSSTAMECSSTVVCQQVRRCTSLAQSIGLSQPRQRRGALLDTAMLPSTGQPVVVLGPRGA